MLSDLAIAYLFLGGTGAGCAFVSSVLGIMSSRPDLETALANRFRTVEGSLWTRFFASGFLAAIACLLLGSVCLCADLGQPAKILMLLFPPKISYLAFGAWSILICVALCAAFIGIWTGAIPASCSAVKALCIFGLIECSFVIVYTGMLLSSMAAVPIWNTSWLVILFFLSSLSCGIAVLMLSSLISGSIPVFSSSITKLAKADTLLLFGECLVLFIAFFGIMHIEDTSSVANETIRAAILSADQIVLGRFAAIFWTFLIGIGILVPFLTEWRLIRSICDSRRRIQGNKLYILVLVSSICVLIGGAVLRYLIVASAAHPALMPPT